MLHKQEPRIALAYCAGAAPFAVVGAVRIRDHGMRKVASGGFSRSFCLMLASEGMCGAPKSSIQDAPVAPAGLMGPE